MLSLLLQARGQVEIKGKGSLKTFWIAGCGSSGSSSGATGWRRRSSSPEFSRGHGEPERGEGGGGLRELARGARRAGGGGGGGGPGSVKWIRKSP